ncbi:MAG TPA: hypothetical protein VLC09_19505 [Polyangiaceae bacterium]|nr:hypothetical protein [Polyangiaceae bacterium]
MSSFCARPVLACVLSVAALGLQSCNGSGVDVTYHNYASHGAGVVSWDDGAAVTSWQVGAYVDELPCIFEHRYTISSDGYSTGELTVACDGPEPDFDALYFDAVPLEEDSEVDLDFSIEGQEVPGKGQLTILESVGDVVNEEVATTPGYLRRYRYSGEVDCAAIETATCTGIWSFEIEGEQTADDVHFNYGDPNGD